MTLQKLAQLAGVSTATASKALSGAWDINPQTRQRIIALAREHGYSRPRARKQENGPTVGVIYSDITSHYYSRLISLFDDRLAAMGGMMLTGSSRFETARVAQLCGWFQRSGMVDALVCVSPFTLFGQLPQLTVPMVGISYPSGESHPFDYLCVNDGLGIDQGVAYLQRQGHKRIAWIGERFTTHRLNYFLEAMARRGLECPESRVLVSAERFQAAGYEAMRHLLSQEERPTAVFAAYDDIALGAARAIREAGLRIPEDISLAGIDNTMAVLDNGCQLASVNCHIEEQVDIALDIIMKKLRDPTFTAIQSITVRSEFVPGGTVAPPQP